MINLPALHEAIAAMNRPTRNQCYFDAEAGLAILASAGGYLTVYKNAFTTVPSAPNHISLTVQSNDAHCAGT